MIQASDSVNEVNNVCHKALQWQYVKVSELANVELYHIGMLANLLLLFI